MIIVMRLLLIKSCVVLSSVLLITLNSLNNLLRWIFLLWTALFTYHTMHPSKGYSSVAFSIFAEQFDYHYNQFQNIFLPPGRDPVPLSHRLPTSPVLSPRTTIIHFVSIDLPVLDTQKADRMIGKLGVSEKVTEQLKVTQIRKGNTWDLNPDLSILQFHIILLYHRAFFFFPRTILKSQPFWLNWDACFISIVSLNPYNHPGKQVQLLYPFCRGKPRHQGPMAASRWKRIVGKNTCLLEDQ